MLTLLMLVSPGLTGTAQAARVTDLPPMLRGDVSIGYGYGLERGSLVEPTDPGEDTAVGLAQHDRHQLYFGGAFSPYHGITLAVSVPYWLQHRQRWVAPNPMIFDPSQGLGSMAYQSGSDNADIERVGAGLGGTWLDLKVSPFNRSFESRGNLSTWVIDLGYRLSPSTSFHTVDESGERGGGPGAAATKIGMSFSTVRGTTEPWISGTWINARPYTVDLVGSDGEIESSDAVLDLGQSLELGTGIQVHTTSTTVDESDFAIDFRLGYAYQSWQDLPSGYGLPTVLDATNGSVVSVGEYNQFGLGVGLYWPFTKYVRFDAVCDVNYVMPHTMEHPYPVRTGGDFISVDARADLTVTIR